MIANDFDACDSENVHGVKGVCIKKSVAIGKAFI